MVDPITTIFAGAGLVALYPYFSSAALYWYFVGVGVLVLFYLLLKFYKYKKVSNVLETSNAQNIASVDKNVCNASCKPRGYT